MGLRLIKLHPIKSAAGMIPIYAGWARGSLGGRHPSIRSSYWRRPVSIDLQRDPSLLVALKDYRLINKGIAIFINGQRQCIRRNISKNIWRTNTDKVGEAGATVVIKGLGDVE